MIVPVVELPPTTVLTIQLAVWVALPATVAVNCNVSPVPTVSVVPEGEIVMETPEFSVTEAVPVTVEFWLLTAVMRMHPLLMVVVPVVVHAVVVPELPPHMVVDEGRAAGPVYRPFVDIVPHVAFPPVTPLTCQVTVVSVALETEAVNGAVPSKGTVAVDGDTTTVTVVPVLLQAVKETRVTAKTQAIQPLVCRTIERCISPDSFSVSFSDPARLLSLRSSRCKTSSRLPAYPPGRLRRSG